MLWSHEITKCSPKPMYSNYGGIHEKRLGDFRTKIKGNELFCEVKLVHDYTANKWISEINKDTVALQKVTNATAVQIHIFTLRLARPDCIENGLVFGVFLQSQRPHWGRQSGLPF